MELGRNLFLEGFDEQLVGVKKDDTKIINAKLPANHPKKELSNKQAKFECKILNIKKPKETKIDDDFAKLMGAKDIKDLKSLMKNKFQVIFSSELNYKKEILIKLKNHQVIFLRI